MMKRFAVIVLAMALAAATCAAGDAKPVLLLQWQKGSGGSCMDKGQCDMSSKEKCGDGDCSGMSAKEVKKAYSTLKRELAAEGVKVKLKKVKGDAVPSAMPSECHVWVSDVPMEVWLGTEAGKASCGGCQDKAEGGRSCSDLVVQAGHRAADHLLANGKIDPAEFSKPTGCGGCSGKSGCGGTDKTE